MVKKDSKKKTLVIVESPGKLSKISEILGSDYVIRASYGHIMELCPTAKNKFGIDIENGFKLKYGLIPDKKDKVKILIDSAANAKEILVASDPDREGEAISYHIKDCLESAGVPIKRIVFNEITKTAVLKAISKPIEFNKDLYDAQQARRALDRLVGFMCSPWLIKTIGPNLSAGRVQSVAVRLVTDREEEIKHFQPEEYWNIFTTLAKAKSLLEKFDAKLIKKITNKDDASKVKSELENDQFIVTSVEAKEKKRNPFPPLTTSKLQQVASGRYGIPIADIMKAAQSLYEAGLITYMRTDSVRSSPESIEEVRAWLLENNHSLPLKANVYASKGSAQDAHEAIRPTHVEKTPDTMMLSDDQKKVYRVIWERFVASQMEPALYDTLSILIKTSSGHELKASGRTLKSAGWLSVATDQVSVKSDDEDDIQLPMLKVGDNLILVEPKVKAEQKFTQPPPRYGEAILVKELEKRGIGRPSTYASIVETIKNRGYVELKNKVYHGTDIGKQVIDKLTKYFKFLEYDYTANMEEQLDGIAEGKLKYEDMLGEFFEGFQKELKTAYNDLNDASRTEIICSKCNKSTFLIKHGQYGYYLSCSDIDCKNNISCEIVDGKPVMKQNKQVEPGIKCPKCTGDMTKKDGKFGPYYACLDFKCGGKGKVPYGKKCPSCNDELFSTIYGDTTVLFCMGYAKTGCSYKENLPQDKQIADPKNYNTGDGLPKNIKRILKKADKNK